MKKLLCGALVFGVTAAFAGGFLNRLSADERKVDSSPFATRGDIILRLSSTEFIHSFTSNGTFAMPADAEVVSSRLLVVR